MPGGRAPKAHAERRAGNPKQKKFPVSVSIRGFWKSSPVHAARHAHARPGGPGRARERARVSGLGVSAPDGPVGSVGPVGPLLEKKVETPGLHLSPVSVYKSDTGSRYHGDPET